jgi:hypothetical protein
MRCHARRHAYIKRCPFGTGIVTSGAKPQPDCLFGIGVSRFLRVAVDRTSRQSRHFGDENLSSSLQERMISYSSSGFTAQIEPKNHGPYL